MRISECFFVLVALATSQRLMFKKLFKKKTNTNNDVETNNCPSFEIVDKRSIHVLFLGIEAVGKSTIYQQLKRYCNGNIGYTLNDIRKSISWDIYNLCKANYKLNQQQDIKTLEQNKEESTLLICSYLRLKIKWTQTYPHDIIPIIHSYYFVTFQLNWKYKSIRNEINEKLGRGAWIEEPWTKFNETTVSDIKLLWDDPAIRSTWKLHKTSHCMDNTQYFMNKMIDIFSNDNYNVTYEDCLRVYDPTNGIYKDKIIYNNDQYGQFSLNMTDIGGATFSRKKWLYVVEYIDFIIYIVSLSSYDEISYEDYVNKTNRMKEALQIFDETVHHKLMDATNCIVLFNKMDIFEEKIKTIPFNVCDIATTNDFNENHRFDSKKVKEFIVNQFEKVFYDNNDILDKKKELKPEIVEQRKLKRASRTISFHFLCAVDQDNTKSVLKNVLHEMARLKIDKKQ